MSIYGFHAAESDEHVGVGYISSVMIIGIGLLDTGRCLPHDVGDRRDLILLIIVAECPDDVAPVLEAISEIAAEIVGLCRSLIGEICDIGIIETILPGSAQK